MKKIDNFINCYTLSKTLRFSLIPVGETEANFKKSRMLNRDIERSEDYKEVKKLIDNYYKECINNKLGDYSFSLDIKEYSELYYKTNKSDKDVKKMEEIENNLRKAIFEQIEDIQNITASKMIKEHLPKFLTKDEDIEKVKKFDNFSTYFRGFFENRANIFTADNISTSIPYRCINDNLPKFLDNIKVYEKISEILPEDVISDLNAQCYSDWNFYLEDIFNIDFFSQTLCQKDIERYNSVIGGYTDSDGVKIQGVNERINLYNQQISKKEKNKRLPLMKELYKQILSDRESASFVIDSFADDDEVFGSIRGFHEYISEQVIIIRDIFENIDRYSRSGIFINSGSAITDISNALYGDWSIINKAWEDKYRVLNPIKKKSEEKYDEDMKKDYKAIKSFSIEELQEYVVDKNLLEYMVNDILSLCDSVMKEFEKNEEIFNVKYSSKFDKKLCNNETVIHYIKEYLDSIKQLEIKIKMLTGSGKEDGRDDVFYSELEPVFMCFGQFDLLYNKVRNYVTQKPYSNDKIKLNFDNFQLLSGWDRNKESDCSAVMLREDGLYYLAIVDRKNKNYFEEFVEPENNEDCIERMVYKQIPSAAKYFSSKQINPKNPPENIKMYLDKNFDKKAMTKPQLLELITYVSDEFIPNYESLLDEFGKPYFDFDFKDYGEYDSWKEFTDHIDKQSYSLKFRNISKKHLFEGVKEGKVYLFQIYSKDFSRNSKRSDSDRTDNLHTMFFKALFESANLEENIYQLCGGAEVFYRFPSIDDSDKIIHKANQTIMNKNPNAVKKESVFAYDIVKDKRYTKTQFNLHLPIRINSTSEKKKNINDDVRKIIKEYPENYVIGIDRGERNLLYVTVIDTEGKLVYQKSYNVLEGALGAKVDYHEKLDSSEKDRTKARQEWRTIKNIKELKQGYLSQVVHEICLLVEKYDAIIALEDLNAGFKRSRVAIEKQVYQNFENMLISKLNCMINKKRQFDSNGGLLRPYQLTNKMNGVNRAKQDGIVFYVPAWLTSKIDPTTGFVNLLKTRYVSVNETKSFINNVDRISYNDNEGYFEFDIDYEKFLGSTSSFVKKWTICTYGDRISSFRNSNGYWENKVIVLTEEFKKLFESVKIDCNKSIKEQLTSSELNADFCKAFMRLITLTLQMRNSETGVVDNDYLISPVKNRNGEFYDSRKVEMNDSLPQDADANGAYNIARKALWAVNQIKNCSEDEDISKLKLAISQKEWLEYAQK